MVSIEFQFLKSIMVQAVILTILLAAVHLATSQDPYYLCKPGEVFLECGSACPATCANRGQPPRPCITVCRRGCFCRPGLLRHSDGRCVVPSQCQRPVEVLCRPNEVFKQCGPSCPPTCASLSLPPRPCTAVCRTGCFCREGLVRNQQGNCISPSQCPYPTPPVICGSNEIFSTCVIPCNDCVLKNNCQVSVCKRGCQCKTGFFRNTSGICIPEAMCPVRRPPY